MVWARVRVGKRKRVGSAPRLYCCANQSLPVTFLQPCSAESGPDHSGLPICYIHAIGIAAVRSPLSRSFTCCAAYFPCLFFIWAWVTSYGTPVYAAREVDKTDLVGSSRDVAPGGGGGPTGN